VLELARRALPSIPNRRSAQDLRVLSRSDTSPCRSIWRIFAGITNHSGVVFGPCAGRGQRGRAGRALHEVGKAFGRRAAGNGFSMDLRDLASTAPHEAERPPFVHRLERLRGSHRDPQLRTAGRSSWSGFRTRPPSVQPTATASLSSARQVDRAQTGQS